MSTARIGSLRMEGAHGRSARVEAGHILRVGRSPEADWVIDEDPHVSAMHFCVECRENDWWVQDLGSRNGTYVNGLSVREAVIRDEDQITAGDTRFVIRIESRRSIASATVADRPGGDAADARTGGITNNTPFVVGTVYSEDAHHQAWMSLVVKATWTIAETPMLTPDQWPIFTSDQLVEENPLSAVRFESDLIPFKPLADVILVGRAYAAGGEPVEQLFAGIRIGQLRYLVLVSGDRSWQWQSNGPPRISRPRPFTEMDLVYERAFGGIDVLGAGYYPYNVAGTGFIAQRTEESLEGVRLPNLEDPQNPIASWDSRPKPMGFGFYGRGWMPRVKYAGSYDPGSLEPQSWPPPNLSYRFHNGAHPDLQIEGYLSGTEEIALLNVCPDAQDLRFRLPGKIPRIRIARRTQLAPDAEGREHSSATVGYESVTPVLDTLVFVPDEGVFYEVFRAMFKIQSLDIPDVSDILVDA